MKSSQKLASIACATIVSLAVGACSSTSKNASTSASSGGARGSTAAQPGGSPIKIGEICSCSGTPGFSEFVVPAQKAVRAWANAVNASGGINGHPVQLVTKDDATSPGTSASEAQSLISDHVVAIIDDTTLDSAWESAVAAAKIPVVSTDSINATNLSSSDFYPVGQTNDTTLQAVVAIAKAAGAKKLGNMYAAEAPSAAQSVPFMKTAAKAAGLSDVYNEAISATAPNYTAQCLAARQAGVNALFIGDAPAVDDRVATDCAQQGYHPIYLTEGAGFDMAQASSPAISKNLWSQYPDLPFWADNPAVRAFNAAMDKYYPGVRENPTTFVQDDFMAWISAKLLEHGIRAGGLTARGTPSAAEVTTGLDSLKNDTVDGLAPPLTFVAGQIHYQNCYFTAHVEKGTPALGNNGRPTCINRSSS